jgi:hypothetical protein
VSGAAFLTKYAVATHYYIPLIKRASVDFAVGADWTPAAGDVKISIDGGAAANVTNLPTAITMGNTAEWDFSLTSGEMTGKKISITVSDSATKVVEDQMILIETFGNASALFQPDYGAAAIPVNVIQVDGVANSTHASGMLASDVRDIVGVAVSTTTAQLGVNAVQLGATAQTGRDIGASVLLSTGTGAGQLDFTSGVVKSSLVQILGTALTETSGQIAAAFKKFFDKATPTGTINSIPDVVAGAAGGLFIAGTNAATTANITGNLTGNVTGSVGSVTGAVGSVTGAVGSVTGAVGSVASGGIATTSFAAGAINAAAIAADAIGASELAADAVAEIADAVWDEVLAGHLTAGTTGNALNAAGSAGDPWTTALPGAYGAGTAGAKLGRVPDIAAGAAGGLFIAGSNATTTVNVTGSLSGSVGSVTGGVTVTTNNDKTGYTLSAPGIQAIWDALTSVLTTASSIGKLLVDNVNSTISSRLATAGYTAPDNTTIGTINTNVANVQTRIPTSLVSGRIDASVGSNLDKTGYGLSAGAIQAIWDALTSALTTASSIGKLLVDNINATISSRLSTAGYTAPDNTTIGTINTDVANIQTRIPTALVSGRIDASVGAMATAVITNAAFAANAISDAKVDPDVTIASVTGAVGSVTARVTANADQVNGQTLGSKAGINLNFFFQNGGVDTAVKVDDVGGVGGGVTDWTGTERAQIRHRLGIDGSVDTPSATPSLALAATMATRFTTVDTTLSGLATGAALASALSDLSGDIANVPGLSADAVWNEMASDHTTNYTYGGIIGDPSLFSENSAISIMVWLASSFPSILDMVSTVNTINTNIDTINTKSTSIKAVTDALPNSGALSTINTNINTINTAVGTTLPASLSSVAGNVTAVKATTDLWPEGFRRNEAFNNFMVHMVLSSDHATPATGVTVLAEHRLDGDAFTPCDNVVVELGDGDYVVNLSAADMDADAILFRFTATGADAVLFFMKTS